jgi:hypothetical protein
LHKNFKGREPLFNLGSETGKGSHSGQELRENKMKKLLLACAFTLAGVSAMAGTTYADVNDSMKNSKYCESAANDPLCMGPESMAQRTAMMDMTKDKAMAARSKYCQENANSADPICDPKMMNDTTGY